MKKLSEKHKENLSKKFKGISWEERYGKEEALKRKEKLKKALIGKEGKMKGKTNKWGNHNEETKKKISAFQQGITLEEWKNFKVSKNRWLKNTKKYQEWRNKVFKRDNFICQNKNCEFCKNKKGVEIQAHHIKPLSLFPEEAFLLRNGITYCIGFHIKSGLHRNLKSKFGGGN